MTTRSLTIKRKELLHSTVFDILAVGFVYLIPTFSHWLSFPLYLLEPMRIVVILALVHSSKYNSYLLAVTLPLFSFAIASHPVFAKSVIMMAELSFNVFLFFYLLKKLNKAWPAILLSIFLIKLAYYLLKYLIIQMAFMDSSLVSTPVYIQLGVMFLLSAYVWFIRSGIKKLN